MNPTNPEGEKVVWDKALFKKIFKWTGIVLLVAYLFLVLVANLGPKLGKYLIQKRQEIYVNKLKEEVAQMEALEKADTYGGKTPEETLDLYIEALKKGDIELAAKYSRVDQQEEEIEDLKMATSRDGDLNYVIDFVYEIKKNGKKACDADSCSFTQEFIVKEDTISNIKGTNNEMITPAGFIEYRAISLYKNLYTNVWKIVEP